MGVFVDPARIAEAAGRGRDVRGDPQAREGGEFAPGEAAVEIP